ncbi:hypothetical protein K443DRAFT_82602, partial [Laccaria amethystina LaAM-08-1]
WAKRPVRSHIDHHITRWRLTNNTHRHGATSACYVDGAWRQCGTSNASSRMACPQRPPAIITPTNHCHTTPSPSAAFGDDNST